MPSVPSPAAVMVFLEEKAVEIDNLGKALEEAHLNLGDAELEWEKARDETLLEIVDEHQRSGERLPAVDIRLAMVRKRKGFGIYGAYLRAKRQCEGLEKHGRMLDTAISARQSTLRVLENEARLQFHPDTGEVIGGGR